MSRLLDRILVGVYVALAALPVIAMVAKLEGRYLDGSLPPTPLSEPALADVLDEKFQQSFASWFESHLGLKGNSIAFDNTLLYRVFGETKPGSTIRIGNDRVLFGNEDIDFYNKRGAWLTDPAYANKLADQIADLQRRMKARHRALVPVIIPAKTSIWRDKVPDAWIMDVPYPRASDESTRMVTQALRLRGVTFVDARAIFLSSSVPREDLYGAQARHWSAYGACLAMAGVADAYRALSGQPLPSYDCTLGRRPAMRWNDDLDLLRLLNVYFATRAAKESPIAIHVAPSPRSPGAPGVLFVGTSFCWQIMRDAEASGLFRHTGLNYYNQTFVTDEDETRVPVAGGTATWRDHTMPNELIVLDLFESYLGSPGTYVQLFLDDLGRELDATPAR